MQIKIYNKQKNKSYTLIFENRNSLYLYNQDGEGGIIDNSLNEIMFKTIDEYFKENQIKSCGEKIIKKYEKALKNLK